MANLYKIKGNLYALRGKLVKLDARDPFTVKVNTALGNGFNSFTLPLSNHATNVKLRTSDGQSFTITNYLDSARTINFASAGIYTIELRGVCGWSFNKTGDCQKLIGVTRWGSSFKFSYLIGGFYGCINLGLNEGLPKSGYILSTATTINLTNIFNTCNLVDLGHDCLFQKLKITALVAGLRLNRLSYLSADVLKGQVYITNLSRILTSNTTLTDMHDDVFKDCYNNTTFSESFINCSLSVVKKNWLLSQRKVNTLLNAFEGNNISVVEGGAFDVFVNVSNMSGVLDRNEIASLPNRLFYNCKKVTSYYRSLARQRVPMALPPEIWDLSAISIVTSWHIVLLATNTALSPTGTVQPIWDYASPTATNVDAFQNCTALTNYDDSPLEWR